MTASLACAARVRPSRLRPAAAVPASDPRLRVVARSGRRNPQGTRTPGVSAHKGRLAAPEQEELVSQRAAGGRQPAPEDQRVQELEERKVRSLLQRAGVRATVSAIGFVAIPDAETAAALVVGLAASMQLVRTLDELLQIYLRKLFNR
ncbi:hypothetical protein GPECTOR_39g420 [Gonium pectorale]|uniref:Uncharacterized protein n=1 Tax=Gonium pectorale TaxID=33097 RepID=A0A150GAQ1_GONPE|nr:hypothetical protein GPECTOR_39g420 [Gonium pectorale]|eukprot:KXZ46926.1 hypothetical protein GPECTOR_39g420 [Gonium pectorale]